MKARSPLVAVAVVVVVVVVVVAVVCPARRASADISLLEDVEEWQRAHRGEVESCALAANAVGAVDVWFTLDAQAGGKTVAAEVLPAQGGVGPTPCWRKLFETFHPRSRSPAKLYARATCTVFRPGKNAPATEKAHASLCDARVERADTVPEELVASLVEAQLAPALPSLATCIERHGKHLPQLELVMEGAYSPALRVRYLREQPSSLRTSEEPNSRSIGSCYAERIMAERARLVWPPSLPKVQAPPLDVFFPTAMFGPKAPKVSVRRQNSR
jgi:hypothetical protein